MSDQQSKLYRNVVFVYGYGDALRVTMLHSDVFYIDEAILNGSEWFVFRDKSGDTHYVHMSKVQAIRVEPKNKAF